MKISNQSLFFCALFATFSTNVMASDPIVKEASSTVEAAAEVKTVDEKEVAQKSVDKESTSQALESQEAATKAVKAEEKEAQNTDASTKPETAKTDVADKKETTEKNNTVEEKEASSKKTAAETVEAQTVETTENSETAKEATPEACVGYGPQTPRDIDQLSGTNQRKFAKAPSYKEMNLCNIHFHSNAEHKARDFSVYAGEGKKGYGGGYQCGISRFLTKSELKAPETEICKGIKPGDTIEVHWVHTSCDVTPGKGLGSCLSERCANPDLRVETQVFTVVNDSSAQDFNELTYQGNTVNGYHQAKALPNNTGKAVEFLGSTTGPKYTEQACSPLQVTWSVRPQCAKLDINSLGEWCKSNTFEEDHAHGVRKLVTNPALLAPIH